jgi:drug/metabolite transporter (DMT)-like permease
MLWISVAISSYLLLAISNIIDKFLVDNVLKNSRIYAFVVCSAGMLSWLVAPWFLKWPGFGAFSFNLLSGVFFASALYFLYESLRKGEASRVLVMIGGITPLFSVIFSWLFLGETYSNRQLGGFVLLLLGIFLIAGLPTERNYLKRLFDRLGFAPSLAAGGLWMAVFSAFFYALYFVSSKHAYSFQPFFSVFLWSRLGAVLGAIILLSLYFDWRETKKSLGKRGDKRTYLVLLNQGIGSLGFVLQNYAIYLGSVALTNALQGVQYAFILIISAVLAILTPKFIREDFSWKSLLWKLLAILIIAAGLYLII